MIGDSDIGVMRCPACRGLLALRGRAQGAGLLRCLACGLCARERDGLFDLHHERSVKGVERFVRGVYDLMPFQHDFGVRVLLPIMQDGVTEAEMRARMLRPLALDALRPRADGAPLRVLEVGMGTGSNMPELLERMPRDVPVELWGCDLSEGMLRRATRRLRAWSLRGTDGQPVRRVLADAHALPFADASFDRVFHVGGIGLFRDRGLAMREMARVARPGCPVAVADECLDPTRWHDPLHRYWFWTLAGLDDAPYPPRDCVPEGCEVIADEQVTRFYYCLAFRTPRATAPPA